MSQSDLARRLAALPGMQGPDAVAAWIKNTPSTGPTSRTASLTMLPRWRRMGRGAPGQSRREKLKRKMTQRQLDAILRFDDFLAGDPAATEDMRAAIWTWFDRDLHSRLETSSRPS